MSAAVTALAAERLTPHDLVTYYRCPHEMELLRARHQSMLTGQVVNARTPIDVVPLRHSPLFSPPLGAVTVNEGRLDIFPGDSLVYEDDSEEEDLPVLFSPDRIRLDPRYTGHHGTLIDSELGLSGRPDLVIRRANGQLVPVEYKSTHLFVGYHNAHGRTFDTLQAIAECRLVQVAFGVRPQHGIIYYGDVAGDGQREGWVEITYGDAEEHWLKAALAQIRTDLIRAPVPAERNCAGCQPNADHLCRFAAARYDGPEHRQLLHSLPRE